MDTLLKRIDLKKIADLGQSRPFFAFIGVVLLGLILSIISPYFLTVSNILNVLRQVSIIAIVSVGMTLVIITGGIDLSVGSVLALSAVFVAILMKQGINIFLSIIVGTIVGVLIGLFSGFLITSWIRTPPFIATLATMSIARGLTMVVTGGRPIYGLPEEFGFIGGGYVFGIPFPVIVMLVVFVIGHIYLTYTVHGTYLFAVGGNPEAARLSGINISDVKNKVYILSGVTSSLAGVILASRLKSVEPLAGLGYELDAIAAAVIGGANLMGGEGSLIGAFMGALIMGILRNGLNLLNVSTYWQQVVIGFVIAITVAIGTFRNK